MLPFIRFLFVLGFATSLLGCAPALSLDYLAKLNPRAHTSRICARPAQLPPYARFWAYRLSTGEIVSDRNRDELEAFAKTADSIHEFASNAPSDSVLTMPSSFALSCPEGPLSNATVLPTQAQVEADRARLAIPPDLRAELMDIAMPPCPLRPDPRHLGQTYRDPLQEIQVKMLAAVLQWAAKQSTDAPPVTLPQGRELLPMPPVVFKQIPVQETAEPQSLREKPIVQFSGGAVAGVAIGSAPMGPVTADVGIQLKLLPNGTYWARVGRACGEIAAGTGQIILGCTGMTGGAAMSTSGGGAIVGVPVMADSLAITVNGCMTLGNGLAHGYELLREGPPPETPAAPAPGTVVVKKSESGTTTTTRARPPPGEPAPQTTVTVQKSASGTTTTTRVKKAPSGADAKAAVKGAKRGPKTDPDAAHNAAVRREAEKLKAEGNTILAGGGYLPEKLVKIEGGIKTGRRPDIIYRTPDGKLRGRNVGRTNADGTPVKREAEALDDLNKHSTTPTDFVPYDR